MIGRTMLLGMVLVVGCGRAEPTPRGAADAAAPADPEAELRVARAAMEAGEVDDAVTRAWAVAEAHPQHLEARLLLASGYTVLGRHADALRAAEAAIRIDDAAAGAWITKGAALRGLKRYDDGVAATERALELAPASAAALANLARLHGDRKDGAAQRAALKRLLAVTPDDVGARVELARSFAADGAWKEAKGEATQAVERQPANPDLQMVLAAAHYQLDEHEAAMDRAELAVRLQPDREDAAELFKAAFFLSVSRVLTCAHGPSGWTTAQIEAALKPYEQQGLHTADYFFELQRRFGADPDVQARVRRASADCPPLGTAGGG